MNRTQFFTVCSLKNIKQVFFMNKINYSLKCQDLLIVRFGVIFISFNSYAQYESFGGAFNSDVLSSSLLIGRIIDRMVEFRTNL
jgi:hypothetical protein